MASLDEITQRMREQVGADSGLDSSLKFDLMGEGFIHVAGGELSNEDKPADLTITISKTDLEELGAGRLDGMAAVMSGRMKLSDMGLAMQLQPKLQALFSR